MRPTAADFRTGIVYMKTPAAVNMRLLVALAALALAATQAAAQCTNIPSTTPINSIGWNCTGRTTPLNGVCAATCRPGVLGGGEVTAVWEKVWVFPAKSPSQRGLC
jgi:hypothetical protein